MNLLAMAKQASPYPLRMPEEMKELLQEEAEKNNRSLNAEILVRLQQTLPGDMEIPKEKFPRPSGSRAFSQKQSQQAGNKAGTGKSDVQLKGLLARMMEILDAVDQDEARESVEENEVYDRRAELDDAESKKPESAKEMIERMKKEF